MCKNATFTDDHERVDVRNRVFLADPMMEEKIVSGDAIILYLQRVLLPWQRMNSVESTNCSMHRCKTCPQRAPCPSVGRMPSGINA